MYTRTSCARNALCGVHTWRRRAGDRFHDRLFENISSKRAVNGHNIAGILYYVHALEKTESAKTI